MSWRDTITTEAPKKSWKETIEANTDDKYPAWRSVLAGTEDVALMGYGPNIRAAISEGSFSSPEYIAERDRINQENEEIKKEDPGSYMAGQVVGGAASLAIPGTAAAKGIGLGARLLRAGAMGAAMAAASDTPDVKGQVTSPLAEEDLAERGKNTAMGAIVGPLAELGVSTIKVITPDEINRAFAALQPSKGARREARLAAESGGLTTKNNMIKFARSEGMLDGLPNTEEIYRRSLDAKEKYGDALSTIYNRAQQVIDNSMHTGVTPQNVKYYASMNDLDTIKKKVIQEIQNKKWADADKNTAVQQLTQYFDDMAQTVGPQPDLLHLHQIKSAIGAKSFKEGRAELPTSTEEFWRTAGRIVDDEIKKRVDGLATLAGKSNDKMLGEALREANRRYSLASDIYSITGDAVDSAAGRLPRDPGDLFGQGLRAPQLQIGLSKVGRAADAIPQAIKPTGPQLANPIIQGITNPTRMPTPREIYQQSVSPMTPTQKAKMLDQERKMQKARMPGK